MGSVDRVPPNIRMVIGPRAAETIENDLRRPIVLAKKPGRIRRFFNLATDTQSLPPAAFSEQTFRGSTWQTPLMGQFMGDYRPYDALQPEIVDQMKRNGVIKTGLFLKKAPILAVINKASVRHEVPRIQAYLNHVMEDILYPLALTSLFAMDYGVSLHEKVFIADDISFKYDQNGTMRTFNGPSIHYKKVKWTNPRTVGKIRIQSNSQDYDGYTQQQGMQTIELPVEKTFMFGKGQENNLWGTSDLDSVYEYWYWLELISAYYMRYLEKLGTPPMIGYAPNGTTFSRDEQKVVENMSWLAHLAGRLQDGMAIVMPSVFDPNSRNRMWELKEMGLSDRGELYGNAIAWLEGAIFKGLFVPDKPVSSGTTFGSYALADIQFEAFLVGEEWDMKSLVHNLEKYILRPLLDINFGVKTADAKIQYPPLSRELKQKVFEIFKDLVASHPDFTAVNFQEMADEIGIPLYSEEELLRKREEMVEQARSMFEATSPAPTSDDEQSQPGAGGDEGGPAKSTKKGPPQNAKKK